MRTDHFFERSKKLLFILVLCFVAINFSNAQIISLRPDGNSLTIQSAINQATNGDVINLQPGTYKAAGNRDINLAGKNLVIRSETGNPNDVIIDCQGSASSLHRGFYFGNSEGSDCVLEGVTITNAYTNDYSGAIVCIGSSPTIRNCVLTNNTSQPFAGGILIFNSNASIINCIVNGNNGYIGGGITIRENSSPKIINCVINNNTSNIGGGIYALASSGTPIIRNCTIIDNSSGVYDNVSRISNCIIWSNETYQIQRTSEIVPVSYCDVQGGYAGIQNIDTDPLFVNEIHIAPTSACTNSGDPETILEAGEKDIDGEERILEGRIDIGADEIIDTNSQLIMIREGVINFTSDGKSSGIQTRTLKIGKFSRSVLNWQITGINAGWLRATPVRGQLTGNEADVTLMIDPIKAGYGSHTAEFQVSAENCENSPQTVTVNLEVLRPKLEINKADFSFTAFGKTDPNIPVQNLIIKNAGFDKMNWRIDKHADCNWLNISSVNGQTSESNSIVMLSVDPVRAGYDEHQCQLVVSAVDALDSPQNVTVNINVLRPSIAVDKEAINLTAYGMNDPNFAGVQLKISNAGYDVLDWHIEIPADCNWLNVDPSSGQIADGNCIVTLTADRYKTGYGTFNTQLAIIAVDSANNPKTIPVSLNVIGPRMVLSSSSLDLYIDKKGRIMQDSRDGIIDNNEIFKISNTGYDVLDWHIEAFQNSYGLRFEPNSGSLKQNENAAVRYCVDYNQFEIGTYEVNVPIYSPQVGTNTVRFRFNVYEGKDIHVPDEYATINAALGAASIGDLIIVHPGVYGALMMTGNIPKIITIQSVDPENREAVESTIVKYCILFTDSGEITINGLSFIHQLPDDYYSKIGIRINSLNTIIKNCIIRDYPGQGITASPYDYDIRGGGMSMMKMLKLINCEISNNGYASRLRRSGVYIESNFKEVLLQNCLLFYNSKNILSILNSRVENESICKIVNCTIADNNITVNDPLEGINIYAKNIVLRNSIFANNMSKKIGYFPRNKMNIEYCLIDGGRKAVSCPNDFLIWGPGNIDTDPCFVRHSYVDANGTAMDSSDDFLVRGDYRLKSEGWRWDSESNYWRWDEATSRAIDAGSPGNKLEDEPLTVSADPDNLWGENLRIDMGCYGGSGEASIPPYDWALVSDIDNDGTVNLADFSYIGGLYGTEGENFYGDLNQDDKVDLLDVGIMPDEWLLKTTWSE